MTAEEWVQRGEELLEELRYLEAEEAFQHALGIDPQKTQAWNRLAISFSNQGKIEEAEEAFRCVIDIDPLDSGGWMNLGNALFYQEKYAEAEGAYQRSVYLDPLNAPSWYCLGNTLRVQWKYGDGEHAFHRAIEINPQYAWAWNNLGLVLQDQEKYAEAEVAYRRAIDIDPQDALHWGNLGSVLRNLDRHAEAEEASRRAVNIDPGLIPAWTNLGYALRKQEKYAEEEEAYRHATFIDPPHASAWYNLGHALVDQEKYAEAEEALQRATSIEPLNADTWYNLSIALLNLGKYTEAEESCRSALAINPQYSNAWLNLGYALVEQDKNVAAEEAYRHAMTVDPLNALAWNNLGYVLLGLDKYVEAEQAAQRAIALHPGLYRIYSAWDLIASARGKQGKPSDQVLYAYRRMDRAVEESRLDEPRWEDRLEEFRSPAGSLQAAAAFCTRTGSQYEEDGLRFAVQSKARTLGELLDHDPANLRGLLPADEQAILDSLERAVTTLEMERHGLSTGSEFSYGSAGLATKRLQTFHSPEQEQEWRDKRRDLDQQRDVFFRQVIIDHPELEPFVLGPRPRNFRFSLARLQRRLRPGDAVLELLLVDTNEDKSLLGFLVTRDGLVKTYRWEQEGSMHGKDSPTLEEWQEQVRSTLHIGQRERATGISKDLTEDVLVRWGQLLYGPFIDDLKDVSRLWVSPHSFLTQLPFNAVPFPDGVERDVAVIPSAASLTRPQPKGPRPKPRFTLGVVASDAVEQAPLELQTEEVRRLRRTVKSARRRWELAGNRPGEEPTLANIQERVGLTRCLVLSCHGTGPNEDWGTLVLGDVSQPELVTGRQLVDSLLLGGRTRNMEVDLVVTSACLTGQVDMERSEEWLGLPLALQSVWKTKAMLLTLWEVQELPAMIWVEELVKGLTRGLLVGEAQRLAREKVRWTTTSDVQVDWLREALERLPADRWRKVQTWWDDVSRTAGQYPFSDPVHWTPFVLVGDPTVTVSPTRSAD